MKRRGFWLIIKSWQVIRIGTSRKEFDLGQTTSVDGRGIASVKVQKTVALQFWEEAMSIPRRIREYLDAQGASYEWITHPQAFTAQEVAHSMHVSGKRLAKTVVLDADSRHVMAVLPASHRLNLPELKAAMEVRRLEMLPEGELAKLFPDCDLGAIPPLGNLYGMDVWVDGTIADAGEIVYTAGTHIDAVRMKYDDYAKLVQPHVSRFSEIWASRAA